MRIIHCAWLFMLCGTSHGSHVVHINKNIMERFDQLRNQLATCGTSMLTGLGVCCVSAICTYYIGQQHEIYTYSTMYPYTTYALLVKLIGISAALCHHTYQHILSYIKDETSYTKLYFVSGTTGLVSGCAIGGLLATHV